MANRMRGAIGTSEAPWTEDWVTTDPAKAAATEPVDPRKPRLDSGTEDAFMERS